MGEEEVKGVSGIDQETVETNEEEISPDVRAFADKLLELSQEITGIITPKEIDRAIQLCYGDRKLSAEEKQDIVQKIQQLSKIAMTARKDCDGAEKLWKDRQPGVIEERPELTENEFPGNQYSHYMRNFLQAAGGIDNDNSVILHFLDPEKSDISTIVDPMRRRNLDRIQKQGPRLLMGSYYNLRKVGFVFDKLGNALIDHNPDGKNLKELTSTELDERFNLLGSDIHVITRGKDELKSSYQMQILTQEDQQELSAIVSNGQLGEGERKARIVEFVGQIVDRLISSDGEDWEKQFAPYIKQNMEETIQKE